MKKSTLLLASMVAGTLAFGQAQRLVLVEAFSQASCAPCAAQNPALNAALAAAGTDTVVSVKYQTSWPGVDPMNAQNPTEVANRVTYYNVTGVPSRRLDGNQGTNITSSAITTRYGVASPFTVSTSHTVSANYDSIFVNVTVTAAQNFNTTNTLKLHTVLVEKHIAFATAPGSNGEKDFYSVMRKMLPDANGTNLNQNWTTGQSQTFNFAIKTPWYIYNLNEMAIVAFVQDNSTKEVHQAGYSAPLAPIPTNLDAAVTAISNVQFSSCATSINPSVTIRNNGSTTLTSLNIKYRLNNGNVTTMPWTGSLAAGQTQTVSLGTISVTPGAHTLHVESSDPNAGIDYSPNNNFRSYRFLIIGSPVLTPIIEGFESTSSSNFPPANWAVNNPNEDDTWISATNQAGNLGGFGASARSTALLFYNITSGKVDELYLPAFDFANAQTAARLKFDVAYAQYTNENDRLEVQVSTNCGSTWTTLYNKAGATLSTAAATTSSFVPTATQWRAETVNLDAYIGNANVLVRFKGTSAYGNNLFVDNINIQHSLSTVGMTENVLNNTLNVYPNPFSNIATISFTNAENQNVTITVFDSYGKQITQINKGELAMGEYTEQFDGSNLPAGIYFVNITAGNSSVTKKVSIAK
jgi:hypothetical protein